MHSVLSHQTPLPEVFDKRLWLNGLFLFLSASAAYWFTRSPGLDEIDSVNFAMGVYHFNLWEHQPHPPGYPLYVLLGRLGMAIFGAEPNNSLHFVSAIGGGLLAAAWFIIIRLQFNGRLAWWIAGCLAITPVVWMTSTKVLTDSLAAGLLSTQVLGAVIFSQTGNRKALLATGLLGAAAAGARPQLILVVAVVLATGLIAGPRVSWKWKLLGWACLIGGCLLWLVPMWDLQCKLRPGVAAGSVYPHLVYTFWTGRLNKPSMYLFADSWTFEYIAGRCAFHFLGWYGVGFGFLQSWPALVLGALVSIAGFLIYLFGRRRDESDRRFWKFHVPWAVVHIAAIFISLPASQRYYVVIFPLLLVLLLRGLLQLSRPWNHLAFAVPAVLLLTTVPVAIANHRDDAPPVRFVQHLQKLHPADKREKVVLLLSTRTKRHAEWYSADFRIVSPIPKPELIEEMTKDAAAVYTDDPWAPLPEGWYRVPLNAFTRSAIIYWKVHYLELYLVSRPGNN